MITKWQEYYTLHKVTNGKSLGHNCSFLGVHLCKNKFSKNKLRSTTYSNLHKMYCILNLKQTDCSSSLPFFHCIKNAEIV